MSGRNIETARRGYTFRKVSSEMKEGVGRKERRNPAIVAVRHEVSENRLSNCSEPCRESVRSRPRRIRKASVY